MSRSAGNYYNYYKEGKLHPSQSKDAKDDKLIASEALLINLQRTASPAYIKPEQKLLLEIVGDKVRICRETEALLYEVNHPHANWAEIVDPLRTRVLQDFYYYNEHERASEAFLIFFDLLFQCLENCSSLEDKQTRCFATILDFMELIGLKGRPENKENETVINKALFRLYDWLSDKPAFAAKGTTKIRRVLESVLPHGAAIDLEIVGRLYLYCQKENYRAWLSGESLEKWFSREKDRLLGGRDYQNLIGFLSRKNLQGFLKEVNSLEAELPHDPRSVLQRSLALPDFKTIAQEHLKIARKMEDRKTPMSFMDKTRFLLHLLEIQALTDYNETILRELGSCIVQMRNQDESLWNSFLKDVFRILRDQSARYRNAVLDCVHTIGQEVYKTGNRQIVENFIDEVIQLGFEYPDIQGVNEEWQVVVNPLHMKNLRVWLSLIQMNPSWSRKLISALIINLRLGGLFVSDTNLFQKDVSRLLSADIRSCYALVKALARLFPVYFHEIGAEGELREVSTEVDELTGRRDLLVHFLRKQSHVDSNNQIVFFIEKIVEYWCVGDKAVLLPYLPREIYEQISDDDPFRKEMAPLFRQILTKEGLRLQDLLDLSDSDIHNLILKAEGVSDRAVKKAELLIHLYRLLVKKYTIHHHGILRDLRESNLVDSRLVQELEESLEKSNYEGSLRLIHQLLEFLRENILSPEESQPQEEIYRKRHIAAGIPSMYGRYKEKKFDSMMLTFRLENLVDALFDKITGLMNLEYVTHSTLRQVHKILEYFMESLRLDGIAVEALAANLDLLEHALESRRITLDQYLNIFQFIARTTKEIIQTQYIGVHESNLRIVIMQFIRNNKSLPFKPSKTSTEEEIYYQASEWFIRDHLATRFCIQKLDNFIGKVIAGLAKESQTLDQETRTLLLSYNPERCFISFESKDKTMDTQIYLGNKGYFLKCLHSFGYPVPPGFVVTTEFFRCRSAILAFDAALEDCRRRLEEEVHRLEEKSGRKLGDPNRPLLLSVRSGSIISMPGMMDTFLNIGINDEIAEKMAEQPRFAWSAWDNYRRFLQRLGMSYGIPRDLFDEIMSTTKRKYKVTYKREFSPEHMRELVNAYKKLFEEKSLPIPQSPWEQLRTAIYRVLDSWLSETASLYRKAMNIASEWGTAVVVQQMVYGNLDKESGTGVVFTRNPKKPDSAVTLYGDYMICIQGEDVVSGLVTTNPISERQRIMEDIESNDSLEIRFPGIYQRLKELAEDLVIKRGFNHQEIEFTFEGPNPDSLFILQTRDMAPPDTENLRVFIPTPELEAGMLGTGVGVGGGALSGLAVHQIEEVEDLRKLNPGVPLIMLRPDTVPDDIDMILKVDGILTARGGSTSHAAVAAYRLGKTCVVGCSQLQVNERESKSILRGHVIKTGDWISLDGHNGFIYIGRHETMPLYESPYWK